MNRHITINGKKIGPGFKPYIIAELSANHNGDINRAYQIMEGAVEAGADAIKIQTYTHKTMTIDCDNEDFQIKGGLWHGQSLYELYKKAHLPWEWNKLLFDKARELGITIFSTPFDSTAVDLLEELNTPAYKIASFELIDLPLIARVAKTGKPMIISTGMGNLDEIEEAIFTAKENGCTELIVLHCVSAYPVSPSQYNLATMVDIANRFDVLTGLSDHTIENATSVSAVALGACLIEKHVTLDRSGGGADDSFSLEMGELGALCRDTKTAWESRGVVNYEKTDAEKGNVAFRRSIYVVKDIKAGEKFTNNNIRIIRPGFGLLPKYYDDVLCHKAKVDISRGTALTRQLIE